MKNQSPSGLPWSKVWSFPGLNKIKICIWRILHEALTTASYLHNRHILSYSSCFICSASEESLLHVLRDCVKAKSVWVALKPELSQDVKLAQMDLFKLLQQGSIHWCSLGNCLHVYTLVHLVLAQLSAA